MVSQLAELGMQLAVPFNHDEALFAALERHKDDIAEIYLPAPPDVAGTGRVWTGPDPDTYRRELPALVQRARGLGIEVNLVLNSIYQPSHTHGDIVDWVARSLEMGVTWCTVADLALAESIRAAHPQTKLVASTIAFVDSVVRARYWLKQAAVDRIVLPRELNKRPDRIATMSRLGVPLEVIVDEFCLPSCPYAVQHFAAIGGCGTADEKEADQFTMRCWPMKATSPWEQYQSELLPMEVPRLAGLVQLVKITGRGRTTDFIVHELERYTALASDRHGIFDYRMPPKAWDKIVGCDRICEDCGFCEETFKRHNPDFDTATKAWMSRHTISER